MLDFKAVQDGRMTYAELAAGLQAKDLHGYTDESIDHLLSIISGATDADVVFEPQDPAANDTFGRPEDATMAWTLGHVIVHVTASAEEGGALASSLARGLAVEGRSRYEVSWDTVHTIQAVRQRLEESRRMRHAFLQTWPDQPHLEVDVAAGRFGKMNAAARFIFALGHEVSHYDQLQDIMRQAMAARTPTRA
ncbi:MAG: DinB family protein [Herpetosiphon sp.]